MTDFEKFRLSLTPNQRDTSNYRVRRLWELFGWTYRDVLKRHTAKRNNLKYLEIFSDNPEVCIQALEDKLKTLEQG